MFYEYAVDPDSLAGNWKDTRNILEKFGFEQGRLISRFPGKWFNKAYNCLRDQKLKDVERKVLETALEQIKNRGIIPSNRIYNPDSNWLTNAVEQHNKLPFHAIIESTGQQTSKHIIQVDDVSTSHPLIKVSTERRVSRTGTELALAVGALLSSMRKYLFVDPYFDISNRKYQETLKACMTIMQDNWHYDSECQIHFDTTKCSELKHQIHIAERDAHKFIPEGMSIVLYPWAERENGEDFHARCLLTEKGGVRFDSGFSAEGSHQTVSLILMKMESCFEEMRNFDISENRDVYKFNGPRISVHSNGNVEQLD